MFAVIETNGATHILINIPHEGAEKSLPQLASMLENNAKFVAMNYYKTETVAPSTQIHLGDKFTIDGQEGSICVGTSSAVLDEHFMIEKSEAHISLKRKIEEAEKVNKNLRDELQVSKNKIEALENMMENMSADLQKKIAGGDAAIAADGLQALF